MPRGDIGGEFKDELLDEPRVLGDAIPRSTGLGLTGRPGLIKGGDAIPLEASEAREALSIPAKEPALESGGDKCRRCAFGGAIGTVRGLVGIGSVAGENFPSLGVVGRDFEPFPLFFDKLLNSASFIAAASRSLSSSSRVFRRPRSVNVGISSTSRISS